MTNFRLTWVDFTKSHIPNSRGIQDSDDLAVIASAAQVVIDKLAKEHSYTLNNYSMIILSNEEIWSFIKGGYQFMAVVIFSHAGTGSIEHALYLSKFDFKVPP